MVDSIVISDTAVSKEGKYLTFSLANEEYGLEILKVREIIGYMNITLVPRVPHYIKGVINLRGQIIPIIDLRTKLDMEEHEITDQTCIIVVEASRNNKKFTAGLIVDHVQEVLDIAAETIEDTLSFGSNVSTNLILGMAKLEDSVKILLDIDRVLMGDDMAEAISEIQNSID